MIPTPDDLRAQIKALPQEQKDELQRRWPAGVPKSLADRTPTELEKIAQAINDVTQAPFEDIDREREGRIAALTARLQGLPEDIKARVESGAVLDGIPNLRSPSLTSEHIDRLDTFLERADHEHFDRITSMGKAVAAIDGETDLLEALCAFVTGMQERDPNRLTFEQARDLEAATRLIAHGALEVTTTNGGKPQVSWSIDWKAVAKERGVTQKELLDRAKVIAERDGLNRPKNLLDLSPFLAYVLLLETPEVDPDLEGGGEDQQAPTVPAPLEPPPSDDVLGTVELVLKEPGSHAARVVLRVPRDLVEHEPERLYVRRVS